MENRMKEPFYYGYTGEERPRNPQAWMDEVLPIVVGLMFLGVILGIILCIHPPKASAAEIPPVEQIASAIYKAEGGTKTNHPYGILTRYKHTTPKQACINTINHALRDWNGKGDFIVFLGNRYCPVGARNDPRGLNKNWVRNVKYFLARAK